MEGAEDHLEGGVPEEDHLEGGLPEEDHLEGGLPEENRVEGRDLRRTSCSLSCCIFCSSFLLPCF